MTRCFDSRGYYLRLPIPEVMPDKGVKFRNIRYPNHMEQTFKAGLIFEDTGIFQFCPYSVLQFIKGLHFMIISCLLGQAKECGFGNLPVVVVQIGIINQGTVLLGVP